MSIVLLGAQRPEPNLREALDAGGVEGPLLAITAGWRLDEGDVGALRDHVGRPLDVLPVYRWFEEAYRAEPELMALYSERQRRILAYKKLYHLRIRAAVGVVRDLVQRLDDDPALVVREAERAVAAACAIDAEALESLDALRKEFAGLDDRFESSWVAERRAEAAERIAESRAVLLAGGHVAVLRNRLLFFGIEHALADADLFAWGAGAMVLTDRIVLFYDDPPQGSTEPEVLDRGLGFVSDVALFPHARQRLRLDDRYRVAALARRFGRSIALENGAWLEWDGEWKNRGGEGSASVLRPDGRVEAL